MRSRYVDIQVETMRLGFMEGVCGRGWECRWKSGESVRKMACECGYTFYTVVVFGKPTRRLTELPAP